MDREISGFPSEKTFYLSFGITDEMFSRFATVLRHLKKMDKRGQGIVLRDALNRYLIWQENFEDPLKGYIREEKGLADPEYGDPPLVPEKQNTIFKDSVEYQKRLKAQEHAKEKEARLARRAEAIKELTPPLPGIEGLEDLLG